MALLVPVANATITQRFGPSPFPYEYAYWHSGVETAMFGWYSGAVYEQHFHAGVDYAAGVGTPIVASETGVVQYSGWAAAGSAFDGGGIICIVKIAGGMLYVNAHMNAVWVGTGQLVHRGQQIGTVGTTGLATGPHSHFATQTLTSSGANLFRNPDHFIPGGKYQNSPLIQPPAPPPSAPTAHVVFTPYPKPRVANIAPSAVINGYDYHKPNQVVQTFKASSRGSSFMVNGKLTVTWTPPGPIPRGTFLQGDANQGGVFRNLLVIPSVVTPADAKSW